LYTGDRIELEAHTVEDLCLKTERQFERYKHSGKKTQEFIKAALAKLGLRIGMTADDIEAYRRGEFKL
jgi:DNA-directed RNA polymerase alpha subunit